ARGRTGGASHLHDERSARALVTGARHAVTEGVSLPGLLDRNATNVEEASENQIRSRPDLECLAGAFHLDQGHVLEHRAGFPPLGSPEIQGATREQQSRCYQPHVDSHEISSRQALENTRESVGRPAGGRSGNLPGTPVRLVDSALYFLAIGRWHDLCFVPPTEEEG